jgi:PIN domain nuclease of toxin-antitoxin system
MDYLADTVTVIRHFSKTGKIGKRAKVVLQEVPLGRHRIYISAVSLVEIMYLAQKHRIGIDLSETLDTINNSTNYFLVDLTPEIVVVAETVEFYEIFDRLIVATAKFLNIPILTSDEKIKNIPGLEVVWE